ncbi:MAG: hypothetical protein KW793_03235 [Candidatus Doudnabacteria bacterium]|nr:hypothetical protein [Candidatus Doudnabacteria bacterium]
MIESHKHPFSDEEIEGVRLTPHTQLQAGDVYDSTDGKWRTSAITPGSRVPIGDHVRWVRPSPKAITPSKAG